MRCHRQLVGKIQVGKDNVIELACPQCKKDLKRDMGLSVAVVLHRFTLDGTLLDTRTIARNGSE